MLLSIILLVIIGAVITFFHTYPPFGGRSNPATWIKSANFQGKIFVNQISTSMSIKGRDMLSLLREQMQRSSLRQPPSPIQPEAVDIQAFLSADTPQLIWLGHSSVLLRIAGKTILTDPIFSQRSSPFPFAGPKRVISQIPLKAEELPPIDIVLISHDHYDHLDYDTIRKLRGKTTKFLVPLGVAVHLRKWGVKPEQIEELDWWDQTTTDGFEFVCTPSRHFSGRTFTDRFKTLWCSWVIDAPGVKIYFSGDTGYGPHFKQIGQQYGPFDLTLMECGQYNTRWSTIHMLPEQTVQAHQDLGGKRLFPIHWGAFVLALHPWNGSVERAQKASLGTGVILASAKIGELLPILATTYAQPPWWKASTHGND